MEKGRSRRILYGFTKACALTVVAGCALTGAEPERQPGFGPSETELAAAVARLGLEADAEVLVAVGDIARCERLEPARATAELVTAIVDAAASARVITLGDHAYESGTRAEFDLCYDVTWGRLNDITRPTPGNHDMRTAGGEPYYDYFTFYTQDERARRRGYYGFRFAGWQIFALNSLEPMGADSEQMAWLERELRASDAECVLAYWHHPLFSSGRHGFNPWDTGEQSVTAWELLARFDADLIVNAHEHFYERFEPLTRSGEPAATGIPQFIVGTGGAELRSTIRQRDSSAIVYNDGYGVLVLVLGDGSYRWAFLGTDGAIHDRSEGETDCRS